MQAVILIAAYLAPSIVAVCRRDTVNYGSVIVVNLLLGWTVIGWIVSLTMAVKSTTKVEIKR